VYTATGQSGAICKYCALFSTGHAGKGWQRLKCFVTEPFNKWKNALENFKNHSKCDYHKTCVQMANDFIKIFNNKSKHVATLLDTGKCAQVEANRRRLRPMIETIILCGRQELPLRGTDDAGDVGFGSEEPSQNDGNFRALLRMRYKCGDPNLIFHVENLSANAQYFSPLIQNEIIDSCGAMIKQKIVEDVKAATFYSVLVDETTDISTKEQVSLCLRYVCKQERIFVVKESFITYVEAEDTKGSNLADIILSQLETLGLDSEHLVGQGYDGAAAMSGRFKGVQALIRKKQPQALYVHCSSHALNLALSHACQIQAVRNTIGTIKAIGNFFHSSAKRTAILTKNVKEMCPQLKGEKLTKMCETRWVQNHDGLICFQEMFEAIFSSLEEISETSLEGEVSSRAFSFSSSIKSGEFVVALNCLAEMFSYTLTLSKILQSPLCD